MRIKFLHLNMMFEAYYIDKVIEFVQKHEFDLINFQEVADMRRAWSAAENNGELVAIEGDPPVFGLRPAAITGPAVIKLRAPYLPASLPACPANKNIRILTGNKLNPALILG